MKRSEWKKMHAAFSIIEMMIVVSIVAILSMIAIPNFLSFLANDTAENLANTLNISLRLAQTEAIDRSSNIKVCAISSVGSTTCNDTATTWNFGWQIILVSTGEVLHTYQPSKSQSISANPAASIIYLSSGFPSQNFNITIKPQYCTQGYTVLYNLSSSGQALQTTPVSCP
jgi:prepilin-type N-terminal cleavage/methylation domain-containing protein